MNPARKFLTLIALSLSYACIAAPAVDVTVQEDEACYRLDNGIVTALVAKSSGDLVSLRYKGTEMLATFQKPDGTPDLQKDPPGASFGGLNRGMTDHQYGFWSHDAMGPRGTGDATARVSIDPKSNGGLRAEVSVKGISKGRKMGTGPGAPKTGQFASDVEIRYAVERGVSGVYAYCIFEHPADYPETSIGEARFCAKLADFFDWMSVSPERNKYYPKELHEGDKYIYTVVQSENPAFGWSSTTRNLGFYILNASMEYMSGGPTKVEFQGHRDTNAVSAPCVLNYWRSSHYGGAQVNVSAGEKWTKVVGPFLLYATSGEKPQVMFDAAKEQQKKEASLWPYNWVSGVDYPVKTERASLRGRLVLSDPFAPAAKLGNTKVGLVAPADENAIIDGAASWQTDAKHYQFWTSADAKGFFEIKNVRPGTYELRAFSDGVLGEYVSARISVTPGQKINLQNIAWTPLRHGRQLWEIGVPNRNGMEFAGGTEFFDPEISLKYAQRFPQDVRYVIGKSDYRKDWFYQQVPHNEDPKAKSEPFFGIRGSGRATPFSVLFDLPAKPQGKATLRLALCGTGARTIAVLVNGKPAGDVALSKTDGVITRHGRQGLWYERELSFDASLLNAGANTLVLTVPAGLINDGVVYDYLRLELDEGSAK
jgi:rhamnogalacturonan endolyase